MAKKRRDGLAKVSEIGRHHGSPRGFAELEFFQPPPASQRKINPLGRVHPLHPGPDLGSFPISYEPLSARENRSPFFAKEDIIWSDAQQHSLSLSSEGRYLLSMLTGISLARILSISNRRPTGFCLPQGLWHSHRACHVRACHPSLVSCFWSLDPKVTHATQGDMHLTRFG